MRNDHYPPGTVRALLKTDFVSPKTKEVLEKRLAIQSRPVPSFFDEESFHLLEAVCHSLFPQDFREEKIPLAVLLENSLLTGKGKGWRYDALPPMKETIVSGLKGLDEEAKAVVQKPFIALDRNTMDQLLKAIQAGRTVADIWKTLPPDLFFTELLAMLTEIYYGHPLAKEEIGDVSFADGGGWQAIGLNRLEQREPLPYNETSHATIQAT